MVTINHNKEISLSSRNRSARICRNFTQNHPLWRRSIIDIITVYIFNVWVECGRRQQLLANFCCCNFLLARSTIIHIWLVPFVSPLYDMQCAWSLGVTHKQLFPPPKQPKGFNFTPGAHILMHENNSTLEGPLLWPSELTKTFRNDYADMLSWIMSVSDGRPVLR